MKKVFAKLSVLAMAAVFALSFTACKSEDVPEDHVLPQISGIDSVSINYGESFTLLSGVKATDKDDAGNETDLTQYVQVAAPSDVKVTDGVATFASLGDYVFTYYVRDNADNLAIANRKVTVKLDNTDSVSPIINGADTVRIDLETENFYINAGIKVTDKNDVGEEFDLSDRVQVVLPPEVTVSGDGYAQFPNAGDYVFTYYVKDDADNLTVVTRKVEVRNIYNLYWESATLPVLYCALDMVTNNYKSILTFTRTDTINIDALDKDRFIYIVNGAGDQHLAEAKRITARLAYEDEYSYFRLFVTDVYNQLEIFSFMQYGIPSYRYEVKLVSDGAYTYNSAFPYREDNTFSLWESNKKMYDGIVDKALKGDILLGDNGLYYIDYNDKKITSAYTDGPTDKMAIMAAQRDNVELWCAYPETLTSKDAKVTAELEKANMPKMAPDIMYSNLTEEQRAEFLKIVNFDKDSFDKTYFGEEGDYLIITGTNPVTGSFTDDEFIAILENIIGDYEGYNILFKPHPSAIPSDTVSPAIYSYLTQHNVKILPGRLPMEVISWVYSDVKMGGFDSSLFMSVPQGNVEFFIAQSSESLSALTKQLYNDGVFGTPVFYWKEA